MEKLKKPNGRDSNESRQEAKRTSHHWSKRLKVGSGRGSGSILNTRESCGGALHTEKHKRESRSARLDKADEREEKDGIGIYIKVHDGICSGYHRPLETVFLSFEPQPPRLVSVDFPSPV